MASIRVFSRRGCHLCELLIEELLPMVHGVLEVEVHDVDETADLAELYGSRVPVVEFRGRRISEYRLDRDAITALLDELPDRKGR